MVRTAPQEDSPFDVCFGDAEIRQETTRERAPAFLRTDSRPFFDHIHRTGSCHEKRLMVELSVAREAVKEGLVAEVRWVETKVQLADALTKKMVPHALLRALRTSRLPWALGMGTTAIGPTMEETATPPRGGAYICDLRGFTGHRG